MSNKRTKGLFKNRFGKQFLMGWLVSLFIPFFILFIITFVQFGDGFMKVLSGDVDIWQLRGYSTLEQITRDLNLWSLKDPVFQEHDYLDDTLSASIGDSFKDNIVIIEKKGDQFKPFVPLTSETLEDVQIKFVDVKPNDFPAFGDRGLNNEVLLDRTGYVLYKHIDFYYSDQSEGSVFILVKYSDIPSHILRFIGNNLLHLTVVLIIVYGILSYIFVRRVTKPINALLDSVKSYQEQDFEPRLDEKVREPMLRTINTSINEMAEKLQVSQEITLEIERQRIEFLAKITHDTKTPLSSIKAHAEAFRDGLIKDEEKRIKYAGNILKKVDSINYMIDELHLYSDLETGVDQYDFTIVSINHYLNDIFDEFKYDYMQQLTLTYHNNLTENLSVLMDSNRFHRVLMNVIGNSIKYASTDKTVLDISLDRVNSDLRLIIRDHGMGVDMEDLSILFNSFTRGDLSRNPNIGGSGLGLAISKSIVEKHMGSIIARSEYGKYFEIEIRLPIEGRCS